MNRPTLEPIDPGQLVGLADRGLVGTWEDRPWRWGLMSRPARFLLVVGLLVIGDARAGPAAENAVANGDFRLWSNHRGTGVTTTRVGTPPGSLPDGWYSGPGLGATATYDVVTGAPGDPTRFLRIAWKTPPAADWRGETQHQPAFRFTFLEYFGIADVRRFEARAVEVRFRARVTEGAANIVPILWHSYDSQTAGVKGVKGRGYELFEPSGKPGTVAVAQGAPRPEAVCRLTTSWQTFVKRAMLPSTGGKSVTPGHYTGVAFDLDARSASTVDIADVEVTPVADEPAGEPLLVETELFQAGTGGYAHYRIPGLVVTARGTLLAYCEARKSTRGDWGTIDVLMRRSTDGGRSWKPARKVVTPPKGLTKNPVALAQKLADPGEITLNNPVAIADRKPGVVHLLYCIEYARCFYLRSDDDGETFTDPMEITPVFERFRPAYGWNVLATGPGHGIQLATGRLLVPVWLSPGIGGHAHRPSAVSVIHSDDHGKSWGRGEIVVAHPNLINPSETAAVELSDGRLMLNIRNESEPHLRGVTVSRDGLTGWGKLRFDPALPELVCFGSLVRLAKDDNGCLLFANPHNAESQDRRNLTVKLSEDDGGTWPVSRVIEPGISGYSDLAVGPDGAVYCLYERGTASSSHDNPRSLCLARFDLDWLTKGKAAGVAGP
jgi:hypothetical protein